MKLRQTRADLIRPADFCMTGFGNFTAKQTDRARQTGPAAALYCFSESSSPSPSYGVSLPKFDISIAERKPSVNKRAGKLPLTRRKEPCRRFSSHFLAVFPRKASDHFILRAKYLHAKTTAASLPRPAPVLRLFCTGLCIFFSFNMMIRPGSPRQIPISVRLPCSPAFYEHTARLTWSRSG